MMAVGFWVALSAVVKAAGGAGEGVGGAAAAARTATGTDLLHVLRDEAPNAAVVVGTLETALLEQEEATTTGFPVVLLICGVRAER